MKTTHTLAAVGCALALSACGGGGGGGGGDAASPPTPTTTLSTITSGNATMAAENAFNVSDLINASSALVTLPVTGVSVTPASIGVVSPVLDLIKGAYHRDGGNLLTGVTSTDTCAGGGTLSINATLRDPSTLSNGDTLTITANNCVFDGYTENGALSITVSGVSGAVFDSGTGTATFDALFNNFSVATGNGASTVNGDMKIGVNATSSTDYTLAISGSSLLTSLQMSGATVASRALSSYTATSTLRGTTRTTAANFSISGNTKGLGQFAYTVQNLQPFVGTDTDRPTSGSLIVNGASSSVTVTAVANGVRLDYSPAGDGVIATSNLVNWSDFFAAF